jgi:hypothetical protein
MRTTRKPGFCQKPGFSESRTLTALRDTLLPRLLSGELRVPGAERFL